MNSAGHATCFCGHLGGWLVSVGQWLYGWQTLVSGILAIAAAGVGSWLLYQQVTQSDKHEQKRLSRKFEAVRATLPLTLSGLCDFSTQMLMELARVRPTAAYTATTSGNFINPPPAPAQLVQELKEVIEATDNKDVNLIISEIIREIQVLSSRVNGLNDKNQMKHVNGLEINIDEYMIQSIRLHALSESLFDFSRQETNFAPDNISWDRAYSTLSRYYIDEKKFPDLYKMLNARAKSRTILWRK